MDLTFDHSNVSWNPHYIWSTSINKPLASNGSKPIASTPMIQRMSCHITFFIEPSFNHSNKRDKSCFVKPPLDTCPPVHDIALFLQKQLIALWLARKLLFTSKQLSLFTCPRGFASSLVQGSAHPLLCIISPLSFTIPTQYRICHYAFSLNPSPLLWGCGFGVHDIKPNQTNRVPL